MTLSEQPLAVTKSADAPSSSAPAGAGLGAISLDGVGELLAGTLELVAAIFG